MRRRAILTTVGAAAGGLGGYVALDRLRSTGGSDGAGSGSNDTADAGTEPGDGSDDPDEASHTPPLRSVPRPFDGSVEVTPTDALTAGIAVTADGLSPGGSSPSTTAIEALDGNRLLMLSVRAERSGPRGRFPRRSEFELVTEADSLRPLETTGRIRQPVDAEPYSYAGRTGPSDRTRSGWLCFDVPAAASNVRLRVEPAENRWDSETESPPAWGIDLERLDRVDVETTLQAGETITLADTTEMTVHSANSGSRDATVFRLPRAEPNGPLEPIAYTVPAGGERSGSTTVTARGYRETIELETDLEATTLDVEPIRADWGETWTDPNGLAVTCSNPTLADQVEHSGRHSPEGPEEGWQYLAFEVDIVNDTPEGEGALPIGTSFWAVVPADGEHEPYHRDGFSQSDPVTIHSPIEGREWTAEHSLGRGESAGGIVAIRIPDVRSVDDVGLRIAYSDSDTRDPEDGTLAYVGTDAEI